MDDLLVIRLGYLNIMQLQRLALSSQIVGGPMYHVLRLFICFNRRNRRATTRV